MELIDRIHNCVKVFLHSCNTTSIKDVELGALAEFGGLELKVERGEWLTITAVWVDRTTPKEERRWKPDGHGSGSRLSGGGGGQDSVHNIGVDPHLRIVEKLGEIMVAEHSENLFCLLAADGRDICMRYHSKG